jgi:hypothetical protein
MDAEQIRDSMLFVSGVLETKMGGPSADLTPGYNRRTVYAKVSRYRLDQYLQLFDFPSPSFSAEKRHITSVPLQRLFFMNSDFVQQQGELLAQRTENEADNAARIQMMYRLVFGRSPDENELRAGLQFLKTEPLESYEERTKERDKKDSKPEATTEPANDAAPKPGAVKVDGMMSGLLAGVARKPEEKMLPVTPWGRYAKILLSSAEFVFVE